MTRFVCPHCRKPIEADFILLIEGVYGPIESWRDTPREDLDLSARAMNCLRDLQWNAQQRQFVESGKFATAGLIDAATDGELMRLHNFGRRSLWEVREAIGALKAQWRAEQESRTESAPLDTAAKPL